MPQSRDERNANLNIGELYLWYCDEQNQAADVADTC
jgi:hypothetical protein